MKLVQQQASGMPQGCSLGVLAVENVRQVFPEPLQRLKERLEADLRERYRAVSRQELKSRYPLAVYAAYYKRFGYTYHVLGQLESVIRGKSIPAELALVQVMFMAELKNLLLTAVHDLEKIRQPIRLQPATGQERYLTLGGREVATVPGDALITDREAVISSILRGPDQRTCIDEHSTGAVYTVYAPPGIGEASIHHHLGDLEMYLQACAPEAVTRLKHVWMHAQAD